MQSFAKILALALVCAVVLATKGVDYSTRIANSIGCLVSSGYTFAVPRGYCSYGGVDSNVVANIKSAWAGGMKNVDVYSFPCVTCSKSAKTQVDELVNALAGSTYGMIWLDVENYKWHSDKAANRKFIEDSIAAIRARGKTPGIYTSYYNWESIVGLSYEGMKNLPLWYAHYDHNPSFSDFKPFGGWRKPAIKQYDGDKTVCTAGVDLNFY